MIDWPRWAVGLSCLVGWLTLCAPACIWMLRDAYTNPRYNPPAESHQADTWGNGGYGPVPHRMDDPRQVNEYIAASRAEAAMGDWRPRTEEQ